MATLPSPITRRINGYETSLLDVGTGPRVLVTHGGWIGNWELWKRPAAELSARGWRVIAFDHRGSGSSTAPVTNLDDMVDDLFAVMDHCGVEQCVLAGESMGSLVVERAVARDPGRFTHLVVVAGAARFPRTPPIRAFGVGLRRAYDPTLRLFVRLATPERDAGRAIREWGLRFLRLAEPQAARALFTLLAGTDQRELVSSINVPTLVIHGAADLIVPLPFARELVRLQPHAKLVVLPWVGHVPTMTRSTRICDEIERFTIA
ncbi:alpha/beta fold hydrolase [Aeromicrobium sp.]|uniref:alpha/beta fold hydrolase n=1 Tax=Aeromicrobium sp. TaxID=1871063 RepID=UPI003C4C2244